MQICDVTPIGNHLPTMQAMALALLPHMQWRHHGIGCLQGYVIEDAEPEVRLHIWSPALLKPGMDESGDIHDHRFDLVSHVLIGTVYHEYIQPCEDPDGEWAMLALTHARAAKDSAYHGPTTPLPGAFSITRTLYAINAGETYQFKAGHFHRSPLFNDSADNLAISVIEKHRQTSDQARLLYPIAKPPVMAFGHEMDRNVVDAVVAQARDRLRRGF